MALEEQHELCDDMRGRSSTSWRTLSTTCTSLDMDTSASPANLPSESEHEHAHAAQQHCAAAPAASGQLACASARLARVILSLLLAPLTLCTVADLTSAGRQTATATAAAAAKK